jgi:hypothetical protein
MSNRLFLRYSWMVIQVVHAYELWPGFDFSHSPSLSLRGNVIHHAKCNDTWPVVIIYPNVNAGTVPIRYDLYYLQ